METDIRRVDSAKSVRNWENGIATPMLHDELEQIMMLPIFDQTKE